MAGLSASVIALAALAGCEVDSFLDQSVPGRWEETPGSAPILERLAAIEGPSTEPVTATKPRPEDLLPEFEAYRLGPGDVLELTIQDLFNPGVSEKIDLDVDPRGFIDLPQAAGIFLDGKTVEGAQAAITKALKDRGILDNAIVQIVVRARRKLTYTVIGAIQNPGTYQLGKPDLRLLEAFAVAGIFAEGSTTNIFVIRGVPLSDMASGRAPEPGAHGAAGTPQPAPGMAPPPVAPKPKEPIIDLIDELSGNKTPPPKKDDKPAPTMRDALDGAVANQPVKRDAAIDIDDPAKAKGTGGVPAGETGWIFLEGRWVATGKRPVSPSGDAVTQRVIEIPVAPLMAGASQYNIIIRPGDVIRVPQLPQGLFYVGGEVARPGPYNLPSNGRVTLEKAIITAGNLGSLGVPERVDLTRMVGPDRQATIRLNFRAIKEKTHPDVFIRADDVIDVGTNFWAFPLQVLRNGLRMSWGFGFILDRNFGPDVFGPQPLNQ